MSKLLNKKMKKYTSLGMATAVMLSAVPAAFAQTPATVDTEAAVKQIYLASANGIFTAEATEETVNLPFSNELYYGYDLVHNKSKEAYGVIMRELLAYDPTEERPGVTHRTLSNGVGAITINLKELGLNVASFYVEDLRHNLVASESRLFHLAGGEDVVGDREGMAETVTYYVNAQYAKDDKYQQTLIGMEKRASEILKVVDPRMTEAQKVAAIYKKFGSSTKYVKNNGHWIMTGPLLEGGGICGGYSYAFAYLLQRAGIKSFYSTGDTSLGYHAWNYMLVDGQWYFADSTWGGNGWLLKGESSLTSHKRYNTFSKMPTLAKADYNLADTVFSAEKYNENLANKTHATVVSVVESVLKEHSDELAKIEQIYMIEPETMEYVGNDLEEQIVEEIRKGMEGKITGSLSVVLTDYDNFDTVEEFMKEGLTVGYQASDDSPYYYYTAEGVTVYE